MKSPLLSSIFLSATVFVSGCFTVSQTEYPEVEYSKGPDSGLRISLAGFESTFVSYTPVRTYSTVWGGYGWRHGYYGWGGPHTVSTVSYLPQTNVSRAYVEKAQDAFEAAGYIVAASNPEFIVDVKFSGPFESDPDVAREFATMLFSLFTFDWTREMWSARLKIVEVSTGKVLLSKSYSQEYSATVFGLVPIFSVASASAVDSGFVREWCLSALTGRAVADATAFLSSRR